MSLISISEPLLGTDELVTWNVSRRSVDQIWGMLHNVDAVHSTYYVLMHGWMSVFGDSPMSMRMPSALAMSVAAAVTTLIGTRLFGRRAGLYGGLLFALIPVVSRFGQEARSYALVVMTVTLATYLLLRALDRPDSRGRWVWYGLCVTLVGLLHLVALIVLTGHTAAVILRGRRELRVLRSFCLSVLAGVVCVVPVAVLGMSQASRQIFWVPKPDGWSLLTIWPQLFASALCAGALITLAAMARQENRVGITLCGAMAVLPPLVLWLASFGDVSYFRYQYVLISVPAWAALAGAGLSGVTRSWLSATASIAILALLVLPNHRRMRGTFEHDIPHNTDYARAAHTIQSSYRPGDAAVLIKGAAWMLDQGVRYYLPREMKLRDVFYAKSAAENNELYPTYCSSPRECLKGEERIWLVVPGYDADPLNLVPQNQAAALRATYTRSWTDRLSGLTVTLLQAKAKN
ncbi:glycosyltransferase family 39 protein [Streptomyces sp. NPDC048577]|uniref:glycosyltransferase family 39 protein n=1 Tax=Streptomyces sp. NPDC048577 TaxID=3157209 RepID=UPI0034454C2F